MEALIVIALLVAVILGMGVGNAIGRDEVRPYRLRAENAEAEVRRLLAMLDTESRCDAVQAAAQHPSVQVHVHLPGLPQGWSPRAAVIDGQIADRDQQLLPAPIDLDRLS